MFLSRRLLDAAERGENWLEGRRIGVRQQRGKIVGPREIACAQLRQGRRPTVLGLGQIGLSHQERARQRRKRVAHNFRRSHDCDAPEVDARHHARRGQPWHEAGAHERGLAGAARAVHQEKRATLLGRILEPVDGFGDIPAATEEYRCVLGAEGGKSAEWRALDLCRPGESAAMQHLFFQPFAQQASARASKSSVDAKLWKAALNSPAGVLNQASKNDFRCCHCVSISLRLGSSSCTLGGCGKRKT